MFRTDRLPTSLEQQSAFTFRGKRLANLLILLIAVACASTCLYVAIKVARSRIPRRWAWALLALVGTTAVTFNWINGEVSFQLLTLQFLAAAFVRPGVAAPWYITASFPAGALLALRRLKERASATVSAEVSTPVDVAK